MLPLLAVFQPHLDRDSGQRLAKLITGKLWPHTWARVRNQLCAAYCVEAINVQGVCQYVPLNTLMRIRSACSKIATTCCTAQGYCLLISTHSTLLTHSAAERTACSLPDSVRHLQYTQNMRRLCENTVSPECLAIKNPTVCAAELTEQLLAAQARAGQPHPAIIAVPAVGAGAAWGKLVCTSCVQMHDCIDM
jgi:hypothetical protein